MNKKNVGAWVGAIVLIASVIVLFVVPIKGLSMNGSLDSLLDRKSKSEDVLLQKQDLKNQVVELGVEVAEKENRLEDVEESKNHAESLFNEVLGEQRESGQWDFHIPSLMVQLEKKADHDGVSIALDYSSIQANGEYISEGDKGLKSKDVTLDVYGEYHDVKSYLKSIETMDTVSASNLDVSRVEQGMLVGNVTLEVFYIER